MGDFLARIIIAKTSLDGHWRGVNVVARALRDDGFEVVLLGMVNATQIASAVIDEDPDLVGLNIGGRVELAQRIINTLRDSGYQRPIMVGGTIPPYAVKLLAKSGVECFPPGSTLSEITRAARRLIGLNE
jgi:methylmalonyl-CoA mutase C-terminal domain/subunit